MPPAMAAPPAGKLARAAAFVDGARGLFLPLAMACLLAVGAHAAADALGDLFLNWIDRAQGAFDALASRWSLTEGLVDLIGLTRRTQLARLSALGFELAADLLLALPLLGFDEARPLLERGRSLCSRAIPRPTLLVWTRPLFAAALALSGAAAVARMVHGALALQLRPLFGSGGLGLPRLVGLVILVWLIATLLPRCVLRALERSCAQAAPARTPRERLLRGLAGSALLAPLALAAVLRATPLETFLH